MASPAANAQDERQINRIFSINLRVAKKRHEKDSKRPLSEQLDEALKKGEAREAHRLSRMLAGRGMGQEGAFPGYLR